MCTKSIYLLSHVLSLLLQVGNNHGNHGTNNGADNVDDFDFDGPALTGEDDLKGLQDLEWVRRVGSRIHLVFC